MFIIIIIVIIINIKLSSSSPSPSFAIWPQAHQRCARGALQRHMADERNSDTGHAPPQHMRDRRISATSHEPTENEDRDHAGARAQPACSEVPDYSPDACEQQQRRQIRQPCPLWESCARAVCNAAAAESNAPAFVLLLRIFETKRCAQEVFNAAAKESNADALIGILATMKQKHPGTNFVNLRNTFGQTVLMVAAQQGCKESGCLLLKKVGPGHIQAKDKEGKTALHHVSTNANGKDIVSDLLAAKASINFPDNQGFTPLTYAVVNSNADVTRELIEARANLQALDVNSRTCLQYAKEGTSLMKMLVDKGARPFQQRIQTNGEKALSDWQMQKFPDPF